MKGIICYYSCTGNTRIACQYIRRQVKSLDFVLNDILRQGMPDFSFYNTALFATFTDYFSAPQFMLDFIREIPVQPFKPAFVFNTCAGMPGRTPDIMKRALTKRGFDVKGGFYLKSPESYPPLRNRGYKHDDYPSPSEMSKFDGFAGKLDSSIRQLLSGKEAADIGLRKGLFSVFSPVFSRKHSAKKMGRKFVEPEKCVECGKCRDGCAYRAITLDPKPVFDESRCYGCWACYSGCPQKAIYTGKLKGSGHYDTQPMQFREKMISGRLL